MASNPNRRAADGAIAAAAIVPGAAMSEIPTSDPIFPMIAAWYAAEEFTEQCKTDNEIDQAADASHERACDMAETMPTTILGCAALAEAVVSDRALGGSDWHMVAVETIAKALRFIETGRAS